jgi:hypothetical protein
MKRVLGILQYILLLPLIFLYQFAHRKHYVCKVCGAEAFWITYHGKIERECSKDIFHEGFTEVKE